MALWISGADPAMGQMLPMPRPEGVAPTPDGLRPAPMQATAPTQVPTQAPPPAMPDAAAPDAGAIPAPVTRAGIGPVTGFALPRFVSMDAGQGFARRGPSRSHRIDWVFQRRDMPLMIVAEHGHWRRVVDQDGAGGWMHYALLSGRRTALITQDLADLRLRPEEAAPVRAQAQRGVVVHLEECRPAWCLVGSSGHEGWVAKTALWGVLAEEIFD